MQRRIERADHHRESVHGLEQSGEILALHGQQLGERLAAGLFVARQNHGLHVLDAILGEEHVLGAAQADALGAEPAGRLGIARNIGIGAHAEACRGTRRPSSMKLARTPEEGSASSVLALPANTSPVEPSSEIQSPSFSVTVLPADCDRRPASCALRR